MAVVVALAKDDCLGNDGCEAALAAMASGDPDLDPIWGLLVGSADADLESDHESEIAPTMNLREIHKSVYEIKVPSALSEEAETSGIEQEEMCESSHVRTSVHPATQATSGKPISRVVDKVEASPTQFPLLEEDADAPQVTRWDVKGCDAFVLDGVLTVAECERLVAQADGLWTFWDNAETPRKEFRNACTVEVTHNELADLIWQRVGHLLNPQVVIEDGDERFEVDIEGEWEPYAMNPKLLLSRYLEGGHFSPHTDGTTIIDFNRRTFFSCVLFLNSSPWGGHTRIYSDAQIRQELIPDAEGRLTGDPDLILEAVPPVPGRMLVFYHRLMHEGVPAAEKYIIRTDVLYHRSPELCTSPRDAKAFEMYQQAQLLAEQGLCDASVKLFRQAFKHSPALASIYKM